MDINTTANETTLEIALVGRLDRKAASLFEAEIQKSINNFRKLALNFEKLEYISSEGVYILLDIRKKVNRKGKKMVIQNVNEEVLKYFVVSGLTGILKIE